MKGDALTYRFVKGRSPYVTHIIAGDGDTALCGRNVKGAQPATCGRFLARGCDACDDRAIALFRSAQKAEGRRLTAEG